MFRPWLNVSLLLLLWATSAHGETIFTTSLDGATAGSGSPATGAATLTLNDEETEVSYVVEYANLQSIETGTHFHGTEPAPQGSRFHTLLFGAIKVGTWQVDPDEVAELKAGHVYILIHTELYIAGELRGDFSSFTVPTHAHSWGSIKTLFR